VRSPRAWRTRRSEPGGTRRRPFALWPPPVLHGALLTETLAALLVNRAALATRAFPGGAALGSRLIALGPALARPTALLAAALACGFSLAAPRASRRAGEAASRRALLATLPWIARNHAVTGADPDYVGGGAASTTATIQSCSRIRATGGCSACARFRPRFAVRRQDELDRPRGCTRARTSRSTSALATHAVEARALLPAHGGDAGHCFTQPRRRRCSGARRGGSIRRCSWGSCRRPLVDGSVRSRIRAKPAARSRSRCSCRLFWPCRDHSGCACRSSRRIVILRGLAAFWRACAGRLRAGARSACPPRTANRDWY
jgi:hypothetical protein